MSEYCEPFLASVNELETYLQSYLQQVAPSNSHWMKQCLHIFTKNSQYNNLIMISTVLVLPAYSNRVTKYTFANATEVAPSS